MHPKRAISLAQCCVELSEVTKDLYTSKELAYFMNVSGCDLSEMEVVV